MEMHEVLHELEVLQEILDGWKCTSNYYANSNAKGTKAEAVWEAKRDAYLHARNLVRGLKRKVFDAMVEACNE